MASSGSTVLESRGLELSLLTKEHVSSMLKNLSEINKREFKEAYEIDIKDSLNSIGEGGDSFAVTLGDEVLSLLGIIPFGDSDCMLWAMFSEDMSKHKRQFIRASSDLISFFHEEYERITVVVWDQNELMLLWLKFLGFEDGGSHKEDNGETFIKFVSCNLKQSHVYDSPSRPVMH